MVIRIHPSAAVSRLADIEDSIRGTEIEVGERSIIDSFVKIKPAGGTGNVRIGAGCVINSGCVFYTGNGIEIGSNVLIAANCTLAPVNHEFGSMDGSIRSQGFAPSRGGIVIEDDVWIGANCVLLDGATVRTGSVVGAGSVVNGELAAFGVYFGAPARLVRKRSP